MFEEYNKNSQPLKEMFAFNNWGFIAEAWYCVGQVSELDQNNILSTQVGKQKLVLFRVKDQIHCLDAFCPHMGMHLGKGTVSGKNLQCSFHHWQIDGSGSVTHPDCRKKTNSYPTEIRYGLIWIWAGKTARYPLPYHPELCQDFDYHLGKAYSRPSHPHISLLNALDIQHVNTVHALDMTVTATSHECPDQTFIHYDFTGKFLTPRTIKLTGGGYKYSVRYSGATIGFLKALEGIKVLGRFQMPPIYATFGYRQVDQNSTIIQPVFLTRKRNGVWGRMKSWFHLRMTELIYNKLKNEDGAIYENIRFTPNFIPEDQTIITFVAHVNRLPKSAF